MFNLSSTGTDLHNGMMRNLVCVLALCFSWLAGSGAVVEQAKFTIAGSPAWVSQPPEVTNASPSIDRGGVRYLFLDEQVNIASQERYSRVSKLFINQSGVQEGARVQIDFDPAFQRLTLHEVVIRRGGEILNRLRSEEVRVIQLEEDLHRHLYNGSLSAVVFLEDVRAGDVLSYSYTIQGFNPIFGDKYLDSFGTRWSVAVDSTRVRLLCPASRILRIKNHGTDLKPEISVRNGTREYVWLQTNVAAAVYEDAVPSWVDLYSWVQVSEFQSWTEVASWAALLYPAAQTIPEELRNKIEEWKTLPTAEQQVRVALEFVQDEVRYLGFEFGPGSHRPYSPVEVFTRRFGDCKDKTALLCEILRRMRIQATPALVHTGRRGTVRDWQPSPYAFNHVIARVEFDGHEYWLDPTRSHQRGLISSRYVPDYQVALLASTRSAGLTPMNSTGGESKTSVEEEYLVRGRTEPADLTVRTGYEGGAADRTRAFFAENTREEIEKKYLNFYARRFAGIRLTAPIETHDDPEANRYEVTERYSIKEFWQLNESKTMYQAEFPALNIEAALIFPDTKVRTLPLAVAHPSRESLHTRVTLPEPWPVDDGTSILTNAAGVLRCERRVGTNTIDFKYEYLSTTNWVPAAETAQYLKQLEAMYDEVGYTLSWAKDPESFSWNDLNWALSLTCFGYLGLATVGAASLYRCGRGMATGQRVGVLDGPLAGLGGWLVLVGIGLVLSPIQPLRAMYELGSFFSQTYWHSVVSADRPGGVWYAVVLMLEIFANITLFVFSLLLIAFYFQKRRWFPQLYSAFLLLVLVVVAADEVAAKFIIKTGEMNTRAIARAFSTCLIWIPYMFVSKRVKLTFIN